MYLENINNFYASNTRLSRHVYRCAASPFLIGQDTDCCGFLWVISVSSCWLQDFHCSTIRGHSCLKLIYIMAIRFLYWRLIWAAFWPVRKHTTDSWIMVIKLWGTPYICGTIYTDTFTPLQTLRKKRVLLRSCTWSELHVGGGLETIRIWRKCVSC